MPIPVHAVFVMIASPGDIPDARSSVYNALAQWNEHNAERWQTVLVPLRWETSAVPQLGRSPQAIINTQLLRRADVVIAMFGSRLGAPTEDALSGTLEEIERAQSGGKPVHLYFSTAPHPNDIDPSQLQALRDFRAEVEELGLYGTFSSADEIAAQVVRAIEYDLGEMALAEPRVTRGPSGVDFLAQPGQASVPKTDSKGRIKNETKRWVELTNRGDADAHDVTVTIVGEGNFIHGPDSTVIHAGQSRRYTLLRTFGGGDPVIEVTWAENGDARSEVFHVG
ncbi:DUF4062 domain-containing protein [Rhodococcus erythropolis]|uniref:DUF4062 domain-containing protein n=1 Tax=Rhodococcus TaxID=1827 RepID=UPI0015F60CC1|nr:MULTISPECIES: DUF4062 domain-containing protein [Rhodococcus]MBY6387328.1 DUF4062 domain-containing protein [Rhodococcus erythropolis]